MQILKVLNTSPLLLITIITYFCIQIEIECFTYKDPLLFLGNIFVLNKYSCLKECDSISMGFR